MLTIEQARANRTPIDWSNYVPPKPEFTGPRVVSPAIIELCDFIDWSPFFHAWEFRGRYPEIFNDPQVGKQARELFGHCILRGALNFRETIISDSKTYGTIGAIFGIMTWFIAIGAVIILGAVAGAVWEERNNKQVRGALTRS